MNPGRFILELANSLMEQAQPRSKAPLSCAQVLPGSVAVVQWAGMHDEIEGLVAAVTYDLAQEKREAGDFLILVNRREMGYRIRTALMEQGIEAHSFFQDTALRKSTAAQRSLALLSLLVNQEDAPSLRVWLGLGDQDGRPSAYRRLRVAATGMGVGEIELLRRISDGEEKLNVPALLRRHDELRCALEKLGQLQLPELIDELFPEGDLDSELPRDSTLSALENTESPSGLLNELVRVITQPEVPQSPDFVRVMSLHKSKGLTSPVVLIALATAHVIPTIGATLSEEEQQLAYEEGRRLFYVALTRSKDELIISYPFEMLIKDSFSMGVRPEKVWKRGDELLARVLPTPYLTELGDKQPASGRGEDWLQARAKVNP